MTNVSSNSSFLAVGLTEGEGTSAVVTGLRVLAWWPEGRIRYVPDTTKAIMTTRAE